MGLIYIWKEEQLTWRRTFQYKSHVPGKNSRLWLKSLFLLFLKCLFILFALIKRGNLVFTSTLSESLPLLSELPFYKEPTENQRLLLLMPIPSVSGGFLFNWEAFRIQSNKTVGAGSFLTWVLWLWLSSLAFEGALVLCWQEPPVGGQASSCQLSLSRAVQL